MKIAKYQIVLAVLLAAVAGCIGALAADRWNHSASERSLHDFVHNELTLTAAQETELETIEAQFTAKRKQLELAARAANAQLALAMEQEHEYGPEVGAAIDEVHLRMGDLQKATVRHVFAMRSILTPVQRREFDRQISDALTRDPRD
jgi:Spy/CpxP family protein refolding chaperone